MVETKHREPEQIPYPLRPMLPKALGEELPKHIHKWSIEPKWNGVRATAYVTRDKIALITLNGANVTSAFPEIRKELGQLQNQGEFVFDGEIIFGEGKTIDERNRVIHRLPSVHPPITDEFAFVAFDMPWANGRDKRYMVIGERQLALSRTVNSYHARGQGTTHLFATIRARPKEHRWGKLLLEWKDAGFEGFILKRRGSHYISGPSNYWLKYKFKRESQNPQVDTSQQSESNP